MFKIKNNLGFTVVELLVTAVVFIIIFTVAIMDFRGGENINGLQRAVDQLAVNLRKAQTETLTGSANQEITAAGGFGLYFNTATSTQYILFRDNGDNGYNINPGDDVILETVLLSQNMTINALTTNPLTIVFQPPKPTVYINGAQAINDVAITLYSSRLNDKQGVVSLNRFTGRIDAEIQDR